MGSSPVAQVVASDPVPIPSSSTSTAFGEQVTLQVTRAYKDLLIFEERLKGNMNRLRKRRQRYEGLLGFLFIIILYFTYAVNIHPSLDPAYHTFNQTFLATALTILILFFATGLYKEKVAAASKFIPQCNRVLRNFNMNFTPTTTSPTPGPHLNFLGRVPRRFQDGFTSYRAAFHARRRGVTPPASQVVRKRRDSGSPAPSLSTGSTGRRRKGRGSTTGSVGPSSRNEKEKES